jgi:predicted N-acyltransferase
MLREPVARYLERERAAVVSDMELLADEYSPFREER